MMNNKLIMATYAGSHLYGTSRPDSDVDIRGVCMSPIESIIGLNKFEQYMPGKDEAIVWTNKTLGVHADDLCIYGMPKFCELAVACNPNVAELLFCKPLFATGEWAEVLLKRDAFLSTKCIHTFSGYAHAQLQRIKTHHKWLTEPPTKPDPKNYGMTNGEQGGAQWVNDQLKHAYENALAHFQQYETWKKNRNPRRAELEVKHLYDTKHAMHLYRLVLEAEELLSYGWITLPLKKEVREQVLAVYNGAFTYDEIVKAGEEAHDRLQAMEETSVLPKKPDHKAINNLVMKLNYNYIKEVLG